MTKIEWATEVWNPVTGCVPVSEGCTHCYARRFAKRMAGRCGYSREHPFAVTVHRDRFDQPQHWRAPRRIFVCSMGDLFFEGVPERITRTVFEFMGKTPRHTFLVLTKRARRMAALLKTWEPLPDNVWLGVTAENRACAQDRIGYLLECPAAGHFVSCEPMLEPNIVPTKWLRRLDWMILGCESGPGRRPCPHEWMMSAVKQCAQWKVPVFVKQVDMGDRVSHEPEEWPEGLRRREYPGRRQEGIGKRQEA